MELQFWAFTASDRETGMQLDADCRERLSAAPQANGRGATVSPAGSCKCARYLPGSSQQHHSNTGHFKGQGQGDEAQEKLMAGIGRPSTGQRTRGREHLTS